MPEEIKTTPEPEEDGETPVTAPAEKMLSQSEVNRLMTAERKQHTTKFNALQAEFDAFKKSIEDKEKAAEEAAMKEVEELRKDVPEPIIKLLDKMSATEQLAWLKDPANSILPAKKEIPKLPEAHNTVPVHKPLPRI